MQPFKAEKDKGKYLRPELYGQPATKSLFYVGPKPANLDKKQEKVLSQKKTGSLQLINQKPEDTKLDNK